MLLFMIQDTLNAALSFRLLLLLPCCSYHLACSGKDLPLGLLHDPSLQYFRRVSLADRNRFLQDDTSAVGDLVYEVYRRAGDFDAVAEGRFMDLQAVKAFAAKRRDQ